MEYKITIDYTTDESPEVYDGVHDSIAKLLSVLPYMVDNVSINFFENDKAWRVNDEA